MKKSILLVEDTAHLAEEISDILTLEGYDVTVADGGIQGLEFLNQRRPDLIITDLLMPGIDGFELITRIRAVDLFKSIPIIILSAKSAENDKARGMQVGANAYIVKPCKSHQLLDAVRTLMKNVDHF
jgi:DNA-binding response OmpR family regulator